MASSSRNHFPQSTKSSPASLLHLDTSNSSSTSSYFSTPSQLSPPLYPSGPRVQLVPHSRHPSYDASLSPHDIHLLAQTTFDAKDMSSKDFDFAEVFTYDKPQRKLKSVVEVGCSQDRARDWSDFGMSHYQSAVGMRQKVNGHVHGQGHGKRSAAADLLVRNRSEARGRSR